MRRYLATIALSPLLALPAVPAWSQELPATPFTQDPLGPIVDITGDWRAYQPARAFCIRPNVFEWTGDDGADATGRHPACRFSGFSKNDRRLYVVRIETPPLCAGCRRLFLNYSKIPDQNEPPDYDARGHAYFRLMSANQSYTVNPIGHSPNIKNLTNDKLVAPSGSLQERLTHGFDLHAMSYTGDARFFAHSQSQGPYYVGPWYVNRTGERIRGAFLDVDVASAEPMPDPAMNEIFYMAGFNNGEATCPDNLLPDYRDGNYLYAGCFNWFGGSADGVDPYRSDSPRRGLI